MQFKHLADVQRALAAQVIRRDDFGAIRRIAGCDVSLHKSRRESDGVATIVVLDYPALSIVEIATARGRVDFPYVPGYLSFRELPLVREAFALIQQRPDLLILDGAGYAHPRRFGLACHAGIELALPTIGCAKSLLCGEYVAPEPKRGARSPIVLDDETIGYAVRTRDGVKPIFVSTGHRVSAETAVEIVLACATRYRVPEPTRLAHIHSRQALREGSS